MFREFKKIIIIAVIDIVLVLLIVFMALKGLDLKIVKISSIQSIIEQYDKVKVAEASLESSKAIYDGQIENLEIQKERFDKEKKEYDAISDETVSIIKEATAKENYSIEYMWIRLGNYATKNNLSIVLVEPGGGTTSSSNTNTTTQTTPVTSDTTLDGIQSANKSDGEEEDIGGSSYDTEETTDKTLKIQVAGSYMNISDFIFEVENDADLKFKLDNISIQYVSGTTIRATFDIKNMIIIK